MRFKNLFYTLLIVGLLSGGVVFALPTIQYFNTDVQFKKAVVDSTGSQGSSGQVLSSQGNSTTLWVNQTGGGGSFTTTSINGVGSTAFTFNTTTDTNLSIQISTSSNTITFHPNWLGTLADNRITSASYWNGIQANASSSFLLISASTSFPNLTQVGTLANLVWTNATGTNLNISGLTNLGNTTITSVSTTNLAITSLGTSTAGYVLQTNASGTVFNGIAPNLTSLELFFQDSSSSITQYKQMVSLTQGGVETYVTTTAVVDSQILMGWATNTTSPNITTIIAGTYTCHIHEVQPAGTKVSQVYCAVYTRTSGGVETLLGTTPAGQVLTSVESSDDLSVFIPNTTTPITNRFVVKVFARITGGGTAPTIAIGYLNFTGSGFNLPRSATDVTLFVPYTGATQGLDMGAFGIASASVSSTSALFLNTTSTNLYVSSLANTLQLGVNTSSPISQLAVSGTGLRNPFTVLSSTNASMLSLLTNGNVGIGVATPFVSNGASTTILDISGSTGGGLVLHNTSANNLGEFSIFKTASGIVIDSVGGSNLNVQDVIFRYGLLSSNFTGTEVLRLSSVNAAGARVGVGIASSSPIDTLGVQGGLQIVGTGATTTNLYVSGAFKDFTNSAGTNGQVLTSLGGTSTLWKTSTAGSLAINGAVSTSFNFATTSETNIGIAITTSTNAVTFNPYWVGTLADNRITSAANWNAWLSYPALATSTFISKPATPVSTSSVQVNPSGLYTLQAVPSSTVTITGPITSPATSTSNKAFTRLTNKLATTDLNCVLESPSNTPGYTFKLWYSTDKSGLSASTSIGTYSVFSTTTGNNFSVVATIPAFNFLVAEGVTVSSSPITSMNCTLNGFRP